MDAFLEWLNSNEPFTPTQAAIVCAVVFGGMLLEFVLLALVCARAKND